MPQIWLIVGASRGIGFEFVSQLLSLGHTVIATARAPPPIQTTLPPPSQYGNASQLWALTGTPNGRNLKILECDVTSDASINAFTEQVRKLGRKGGVLERGVIDVTVLNAGVLVYPNRISEIAEGCLDGLKLTFTSTFQNFAHHLHTNTIGPLFTAQRLLSLSSPPTTSAGIPVSPTWGPSTPLTVRTLVFISSDSGSTTNFRAFEDGFGAYAASKAALNQGLRHLAAELERKNRWKRREEKTVVLALHPGEVSTDMANMSLDWDVEGIITPRESIACMLKVINEKGWGGSDAGGHRTSIMDGMKEETGAATFWTWEGKRYPW